jgi:DNA methylase
MACFPGFFRVLEMVGCYSFTQMRGISHLKMSRSNKSGLAHLGLETETMDYGGWRRPAGLEEAVSAYVDRLVEVLRAVRRVLRPDGTLWLHLGDNYSSGGGGHHARDPVRWPKQSGGAHLPVNKRANFASLGRKIFVAFRGA